MEYSYLEEIWKENPDSLKVSSETMDDIMSAYTSQSEDVIYEEAQNFDIQGYASPAQSYLYQYDNMFKNDIKTLQTKNKVDNVPVETTLCQIPKTEEESKPIVENIIENYTDLSINDFGSHLIIFLLAGILLIFLFDKLVQLGKIMK